MGGCDIVNASSFGINPFPVSFQKGYKPFEGEFRGDVFFKREVVREEIDSYLDTPSEAVFDEFENLRALSVHHYVCPERLRP